MMEVVRQWNYGVGVDNVSPYLDGKVPLNVISPFHLIAQAIHLENVCVTNGCKGHRLSRRNGLKVNENENPLP